MRIVLLALVLSVGFSASAKDLSRRLGVGYSDQFGLRQSLPSLAARYYPNSEYGLMGAIGVDTEENNSRFGAQAKIVKLIFKEDNMNFYTGAGAGLVSQENFGDNDSGFDLMGVLGGEFFLPGLESLGFTFEGGVGVVSADEVRFRTLAEGPFSAGIIFYF